MANRAASNHRVVPANRVVRVPVSVLLDPDWTAAAKVLWMALRLNPSAEPGELAFATGLSRNTIRTAMRQTREHSSLTGLRVKVPIALLADRSVGPSAKVLYGLLQITPGFQPEHGQFTHTALSAHVRFSRTTLRRDMAELLSARWIRTERKNPRSATHFWLDSPEYARGRAEVEAAEQRLKHAPYGGEALMKEYLSLLVDSDQFTDNARPGFLTNPQTGEPLELDRFYLQKVAFEYHGAQHEHGTDKISQEEAEKQHLRDLIKAGICLYQGIQLVIVRVADLSLAGMLKKIGQTLPLRDLTGHNALVDLLEDASITYCAAAHVAGQPG